MIKIAICDDEAIYRENTEKECKKYFQEKSEREISREIQIPRKTISYRKNKIINKLRKIFKNNL